MKDFLNKIIKSAPTKNKKALMTNLQGRMGIKRLGNGSEFDDTDDILENTVIWHIFRNKSYKCFDALALYAGKILDSEVRMRLNTYFGKRVNNRSVVCLKCFLDLIAEYSDSNEILLWISGSKQYWIDFLERTGEFDTGPNGGKRAGVVSLMKHTMTNNNELVIALHKAGVLNLNDAKFVVRKISKHEKRTGVVKLAIKSMRSMEVEELKKTHEMNNIAILVAL